jgi:2,4-dienoyl-CoA reductase-like NADH-dependent reductase (Old Yellow Enzyme family)
MTGAGAFPDLLCSVDVGPTRLRNRVVSTSHQTSLVHDHLPTEELIAYHEARARGGVGAIFLEATAIHASGLLTAHTIGGFRPEIVPAYQRLAAPLQRHGARLFVQLFHGGREQISAAPRAPAVAPSAVPSLRFKSEPRALTVREITALIDGYATAARYAAQGGVDGVEVSMSHGYLPAQFLSRLSNHRRDGYDGELDGRLRFGVEVLEAVRAAADGRMAVGVRLSADERVPGGLGIAASAQIAERLHRAGLVDFISLVLGHSAYPAASTWIAPPPPAPADAIAGPAAAIRAAVPGATILATTRLVDLAAAERLVTDGTADLVGMIRALIADPELIAKTVTGRADEVVECVGCNQACIGHYHAGVPIGCAVNARTGRERTLAPNRPLTDRGPASPPGRRVLVIGGGPAGAAAAVEAASAGDDVTLVEREAELGGQLGLAGLAPAHEELWSATGAPPRRGCAPPA